MTYSHTAPRERKLSREQVLEAMELYEAGQLVKDIAAKFGVRPSAISYHASKRTVLWRDRRGQSASKARAAAS
jgi:uncharacterized protein YjcR